MNLQHGTDTPDRQRVSRRAVALGAAWAVPALVWAAPAPAFAASSASGCFTLDWNKAGTLTGTQGTNGTYSSILLTPQSGASGAPDVTVSQSRTSGVSYGPSGTVSATTGDFGIAKTGNTGNNLAGYAGTYSAAGNPVGLILDQSTADAASGLASETVTFSFSAPVKSISYSVYDFSSATSSGTASADCSYYVDQLSSSASGTVSTTGSGGCSLNTTTISSTSPVSLTGNCPSSSTLPTLSLNFPSVGSTSYSLTYSNKGPANSRTGCGSGKWGQAVIIGNMTVCF